MMRPSFQKLVFLHSTGDKDKVLDITASKFNSGMIAHSRHGGPNQRWIMEGWNLDHRCVSMWDGTINIDMPLDGKGYVTFRSALDEEAFLDRNPTTGVQCGRDFPLDSEKWIINNEGNNAHTVRSWNNFNMLMHADANGFKNEKFETKTIVNTFKYNPGSPCHFVQHWHIICVAR